MRQEINRQTLELVRSMLMGLALGLLYDLFRPPRHKGGTALSVVLDLLFSLMAGAACFLEAMGAGSGRMGIWELGAALLGFLAYLHLLSPLLLPVFTRIYEFLFNARKGIKKFFKK